MPIRAASRVTDEAPNRNFATAGVAFDGVLQGEARAGSLVRIAYLWGAVSAGAASTAKHLIGRGWRVCREAILVVVHRWLAVEFGPLH